MFSITLITVGRLKEKFYVAAAEEYAKRIRAYARFDLVELPEQRLPEDPSGAQIEAGQKSVAYSLQFRKADGTLSDADLEPVLAKIFSSLQKIG